MDEDFTTLDEAETAVNCYWTVVFIYSTSYLEYLKFWNKFYAFEKPIGLKNKRKDI